MHKSLFVLMVPILASVAIEKDLFTLSASSTSGSAVTATASGSTLPDILENAIQTEKQFSTLSGRDFNATLRYGRLTDAASFSRNAAGTSATLSIPSQGFTKTFTAANEDDLKDQIRDFFVKNSSEIYSKFLRFVNENSTLGISDGNPLATTALMADTGFNQFGLHPSSAPD